APSGWSTCRPRPTSCRRAETSATPTASPPPASRRRERLLRTRRLGTGRSTPCCSVLTGRAQSVPLVDECLHVSAGRDRWRILAEGRPAHLGQGPPVVVAQDLADGLLGAHLPQRLRETGVLAPQLED